MKKIIIFTFFFLSLFAIANAENISSPSGYDINLLEDYSFGFASGSTDAETYTPQMFCQSYAGNSLVNGYTKTPITNQTVYYYDINTAQFVDSMILSGYEFSSINCGDSSTLTGALTFMNYNNSSGDYEISEDFIIGLIVRVVLAILFFTLMWKFTRFFWNAGAFLSPYGKMK